MLKTECPGCNSWVYSPLLACHEEAGCPDCGEQFTVHDVYVASGSYLIYRDVLVRNMHKYMRLLKGAREELDALGAISRANPSKPYAETEKTLARFVSILEELLAGCRESMRVPGGDTLVDCVVQKTACHCRLINISMTGVCINAGEDPGALRKGRIVSLAIEDQVMPEPAYLQGEVVWTNEKGYAGIRFLSMDVDRTDWLKEFIMKKHQ